MHFIKSVLSGSLKVLILLSVLIACNNSIGSTNGGSIDITGKVNNVGEGYIILENVGGDVPVKIDSVIPAEDGSFKLSVDIAEPEFFRLIFFNKQIGLIVLNNKDIEVEADGSNPQGYFKATGSVDMDILNGLEDVNKDMMVNSDSLRMEYAMAMQTQDQQKIEAIRAYAAELEQIHMTKIKEYVLAQEASLSQLLVAMNLDREEHIDFHKSLIAKLEPTLGSSKHVVKYTEEVNNVTKLAIGEPAPDFELPNVNGEPVKLSSFKGKVLLIDFWAAWCRPCRMENPNVVRMYEKFNDKGFEILGVSLDKEREDWLQAIEADGLKWTQVSDLQYFNTEPAKIYNVQGIPWTILIDRDGNILAKGLRGAELEAKLEELFN